MRKKRKPKAAGTGTLPSAGAFVAVTRVGGSTVPYEGVGDQRYVNTLDISFMSVMQDGTTCLTMNNGHDIIVSETPDQIFGSM